jgi:hypothetical protein
MTVYALNISMQTFIVFRRIFTNYIIKSRKVMPHICENMCVHALKVTRSVWQYDYIETHDE